MPENQGSRVCSMCYGDPGHGKDGYYQRWIEDQREAEELEKQRSRAENVDGPADD